MYLSPATVTEDNSSEARAPEPVLVRDLKTRAVVRSRALKGRLGHYARPEGRDEPFRARVFAEPAPFAALRADFQRTDNISITRFQSLLEI